MARRLICKNCGYINLPDDNFCTNCNNDISVNNISLNVDKKENKCFFNYLTKEFCSISPFNENIRQTENFKVEENKNENNDRIKDLMIKICPSCSFENDVNSIECSECGAFIRMVKPVEKKKIIETKEKKNDEIVIIDDLENERRNYSIVIGKNGENTISLVFDNDRFFIGRNHQKCLETEMTVSRNHCYIKRISDNEYALFESVSSPSTNHTYIKKNGGRLEQIEPGKGYILSNGSVFYITKEIPVLFRKEIC